MIQSPLLLPCGVTIKNRLIKSAMSENMASPQTHAPDEKFFNLYRQWEMGGIGLMITGNVMVDSKHLGEAGNVVIEDESHLPQLSHWAKAGNIWVQLNHPGKQSPKLINPAPVAPSAVLLKPSLQKLFHPPRELHKNEIEDIIERFARAASVVKKAGFSGVQIHGAHGYLVSQFLSPHHNRRQDEWGGTPEKRMRFLLEIFKAMRAKCGENFPIGIKLNSNDFQKDGFSEAESLMVMKALSDLKIDLIEISGGNYESPVMMKADREAYFLDFAKKARFNIPHTPLMVTGGFRTRAVMMEALTSNQLDFIGLARPLAADPNYPQKIFAGKDDQLVKLIPRKTGIKLVDQLAVLEISWYTLQLHRMGKNLIPKANLSNWAAIIELIMSYGKNFLPFLTLTFILFLSSCSSSTLIKTNDPEVNIFVDGDFMGKGEIHYSDKKIIGSTTLVTLRKDGHQPQNYTFVRSEEVDTKAVIGGLFTLVPFLWTMKYKPVHFYPYEHETTINQRKTL